MENRLLYQQAKVKKHKNYLVNKVHDHRVELLAILIPAFFWGWKIGREQGMRKILKQLARVGFLTACSKAKRQLIFAYKK